MIFPRIPRIDTDWEPRPTPHLILQEPRTRLRQVLTSCKKTHLRPFWEICGIKSVVELDL